MLTGRCWYAFLPGALWDATGVASVFLAVLANREGGQLTPIQEARPPARLTFNSYFNNRQLGTEAHTECAPFPASLMRSAPAGRERLTLRWAAAGLRARAHGRCKPEPTPKSWQPRAGARSQARQRSGRQACYVIRITSRLPPDGLRHSTPSQKTTPSIVQ